VFVDFDLGIRSAIKRLREALGDSAENPIFVETIDRRGYRWIAPTLSEPQPEASVGTQPISTPAPTFASPWSGNWNWKITGLVAAAALALGIMGLALLNRHPDTDSIAVLPFANGGEDANIYYLSDGITESLIGNLAHVPQLKVKSRSSVFRYKGKDVDAQKAGNELGVSALVSGRVTSRGDAIEVSAELIDVRDNTEIWEHHYSGKGADIVSLQMQIAGDIAGKLRSKGVEVVMYCSEVRWIGLSTNTSPVRSSATSPETSRMAPSGVSLASVPAFCSLLNFLACEFRVARQRIAEILRLLPQEFSDLIVRELWQRRCWLGCQQPVDFRHARLDFGKLRRQDRRISVLSDGISDAPRLVFKVGTFRD
jgi:TolB-like protein